MPQTVDARDYKELYRKTRVAPAEIRKDMRARLRTAGRIGAAAAKVKIREWPVQGGISAKAGGRLNRGLRARLASQISVSAGASNVTIRQGARGLRGNSAADLPRDIDRGAWKHPVYGHGPPVVQTGFPYFKREIASKRPEMVAEVSKVLDEVSRLLT